jgi:hypothetical protein
MSTSSRASTVKLPSLPRVFLAFACPCLHKFTNM